MIEESNPMQLAVARDVFRGDWDANGTVSVHLPRNLAVDLLNAYGWVYVGNDSWLAPGSDLPAPTDEALRLALVAEAV